MARIAHPHRKAEVWLHVDRLDKTNGYVWAVQYWNGHKWVYRTAQNVMFHYADGETDHRSRVTQPKAIIKFRSAQVEWFGRMVAFIRQGA